MIILKALLDCTYVKMLFDNWKKLENMYIKVREYCVGKIEGVE
jgi:hypothetical protein